MRLEPLRTAETRGDSENEYVPAGQGARRAPSGVRDAFTAFVTAQLRLYTSCARDRSKSCNRNEDRARLPARAAAGREITSAIRGVSHIIAERMEETLRHPMSSHFGLDVQ